VNDPNSTYHNHLLSRVPNWHVMHMLVWYINRRMRKAHSRWTLTKKYRKPRRGHRYGPWGDLRREHAKAFALYLVTRRAYDNAMDNYREQFEAEAERIARADAIRDQHRYANPPQPSSKPKLEQTVIAVRNATELIEIMEAMSKKGIN
jgi:hypothetical protein